MLDITQHLLDTHKPYALLCHDTRADGNCMKENNYGIIVVTDNPTLVKSSGYENCSQDISAVLPKIQVLKSGNTPIWPLRIMHDDKHKWGQKILTETKKAFDKGPQPLSEEEWATRLDYTKFLMNRLMGHGHGPMIRHYWLNDFYESIIRYWFDKRSLWAMSTSHSLSVIKISDPAFYEKLQQVLEDDFRDACPALFHMIFEDKVESSKPDLYNGPTLPRRALDTDTVTMGSLSPEKT